jgi:hypothetical protein
MCHYQSLFILNCIDDAMVGNVLASSGIDRRLEPRTRKIKDCKILCFCLDYTKHMSLRKKLRIRIMCPSGVTCLPTDCCFSELSIIKIQLTCWANTVMSPKCNLYPPLI